MVNLSFGFMEYLSLYGPRYPDLSCKAFTDLCTTIVRISKFTLHGIMFEAFHIPAAYTYFQIRISRV